MLDHAVPWARAASWFNPKAWSEKKGADLDGFLSAGPYRPKDGSHLCHHGTCINQHHVIYEDSGVNSSRNRCSNAAQDMRLLGMEIPKHCARHDPPCLLQVRTLVNSSDWETNPVLACRADRLRVTPNSVLHFPQGERPSAQPSTTGPSGSYLSDI